jgi:hypothetical protein
MNLLLPYALAIGAIAGSFSVTAGDAVSMPDKSQYNLIHPTPDAYLRELTPDRPDKTESPYTIDAGHFQVEMDFANFTYRKDAGTTTRAWNVAPINLKVGLFNQIDAQFIYDNYLHVRTEDREAGTTSQSGFGDFTTRLKINLWGDDGGKTAFGLLPYAKFPTSTDHLGNNAVEGGIILPLAVQLPADFELGMETASGVFRNQNDSLYHAEFINSITVGHDIIGKLGGYVEFFSNISTERGSGWVGTADFGLNYTVSKNVQLDCGCNLGVTRAADDVNVFSGITVRF